MRVPLVHQAVVRELAARRTGTHDTKGRSEVSGGGRKPWKQKGTGRARQGSIRATQWKGGGKPFGPTPRSYDKRMPSEMRRPHCARRWPPDCSRRPRRGEQLFSTTSTRRSRPGWCARDRAAPTCSWCRSDPLMVLAVATCVVEVETTHQLRVQSCETVGRLRQARSCSRSDQVMKEPRTCWCARHDEKSMQQKEISTW